MIARTEFFIFADAASSHDKGDEDDNNVGTFSDSDSRFPHPNPEATPSKVNSGTTFSDQNL